ncbi:MAG TPA: COQ9 family protein [Rhizomicrobium sp.]|nr:COQ9 family protein [Rhizomicrobium sp.]
MAKKAKPKRDDAAMKEAVLKAALINVMFDGFSEKALKHSAVEAEVDAESLARLFPHRELSLVEEFSSATDREMEARLAKVDFADMRIRDRIKTAVMARLDIVRPNKEAARRAAAFLTLPPNAGLGARLVWRTVDLMWRAVGDTATDFNFYTKRGILAGVYSATLMRWFTDKTDDEAETRAFLDARIENVMQFEKFKAQMKSEVAKWPTLTDVLNGFNRTRPQA